jgi:hypothetical protein
MCSCLVFLGGLAVARRSGSTGMFFLWHFAFTKSTVLGTGRRKNEMALNYLCLQDPGKLPRKTLKVYNFNERFSGESRFTAFRHVSRSEAFSYYHPVCLYVEKTKESQLVEHNKQQVG